MNNIIEVAKQNNESTQTSKTSITNTLASKQDTGNAKTIAANLFWVSTSD